MDIIEISHFLPEEIKPIPSSADDFKNKLAEKILHLLRTNHSHLMPVLYRIDVNEKLVKEAFQLIQDELIAQRLAELILDKLIQKTELRKKYGTGG